MTGNLQNWGKKALNIKPAPLEHLVSEINSVVVTKLYNIKNGTATEREKQVVFECLGFINLLKFSVLSVKDIKNLWESSGLKFQ